MHFYIFQWSALALVAGAVVAINVWVQRRRKQMSIVERKIADKELQDTIGEGW